MRNAIGFYEDFILGLYERKFLITDKSLMKNSVAVTKYAVLFTVYRIMLMVWTSSQYSLILHGVALM